MVSCALFYDYLYISLPMRFFSLLPYFFFGCCGYLSHVGFGAIISVSSQNLVFSKQFEICVEIFGMPAISAI